MADSINSINERINALLARGKAFLSSRDGNNAKKTAILKAHRDACLALVSPRTAPNDRKKALKNLVFHFPRYAIPKNSAERFVGRIIKYLGTTAVVGTSAMLINTLAALNFASTPIFSALLAFGFTSTTILSGIGALCTVAAAIVYWAGNALVKEANQPQEVLTSLSRLSAQLDDAIYSALSSEEKVIVSEYAKVDKAATIAKGRIAQLDATANRFGSTVSEVARGERSILTRIVMGLTGTTAGGIESQVPACSNTTDASAVIKNVLKSELLINLGAKKNLPLERITPKIGRTLLDAPTPELVVKGRKSRIGETLVVPEDDESAVYVTESSGGEFLASCQHSLFGGKNQAEKTIEAMQNALKGEEVGLHP